MSIDAIGPFERLAYGRVEDPETDPAVLPLAARPGTALVGRVLLAAIFMVSGIAKVTDPTGTIAHMERVGIPEASTLVWIAGFAEIAGGASLLTGLLARIGALGLILFLIPTTLWFHAFWMYDGEQQLPQMVNFMKNLAILGGLWLVVAYGAGRYSLDYLLRRPQQA
jgi:putative oxidoreductase